MANPQRTILAADGAERSEGLIVAQRLGATAKAIEGQFLKTGDVLAGAVDGVGELINALDKLAKAMDQSMVDATTRDLGVAAAGLRVLPEGLAGRSVALERLETLSRELSAHIGDMHQNLAYLRVVSLYIKIAAGGVEGDNGDFALFAQEIADCLVVGRDHLESFDADLRLLDHDLRSALIYEANLRTHCAELAADAPDAIEANARQLATQRVRVAGVAADVAALAREVRKKVGGVLVALQIGDITRQRAEHVQFGLELLEGLEGDLVGERRERVRAAMLALLRAQLSATIDDFRGEMAQIERNMVGIAADTREIMKLQDLAYGRVGRDEGGDFLARIEAHVGKALTLVEEMAAADQAALEVGQSVVAAAARLSERIDGILRMQANVHQMALNATLRCARIGEAGKPITVIAVELRGHAAKLEESADRTLAGVESLMSGAAQVGGEGATGTAAISDVLQTALSRIRQAGGAADADIVDLARQGGAVVEAMNQASARMDCRREIGQALDEAAAALDALPSAPFDPSMESDEALRACLKVLYARYSMAQERDVHRAVLGDLDAEPDAPAEVQAPAAEPDLDDVLF